jgi:hypothetical protein
MTFRTEYHLFIKIIIVIIKLKIIMRFISPKTVLWKSVNGWKILYLKKLYYDLLASIKFCIDIDRFLQFLISQNYFEIRDNSDYFIEILSQRIRDATNCKIPNEIALCFVICDILKGFRKECLKSQIAKYRAMPRNKNIRLD